MSPFIVCQQINPLTDPELWSYDPHEGFIANDVAVDMSGMYMCNAVRHQDNSHETITYVVSVQRMLPNFIFFFVRLYPRVRHHTLAIGFPLLFSFWLV